MRLRFKKGPSYPHFTRNATKGVVAVLAIVAIAVAAIFAERIRTAPGPLLSVPAAPIRQPEANDPAGSLKMDRDVREGDSIFTILRVCGIEAGGIHALSAAVRHLYDLANIIPGHVIKVWIRGESPAKIARLIYDIDALNYLEVVPEGESFKAFVQTRNSRISPERAEGTIRSSLYESAVRAGLEPEIVMDLTEIFGWDINFFSDIQPGDTYTVLYERHSIEGKPSRHGRVLAARFVLQDREHTAIYHDAGNGQRGYYDREGNPIRKLFLKAPLKFRRISSGFSYRRAHPAFQVIRPHLGVDYAAPSGTPVVALGKGRITRCGWADGFGKTVTIEHPNGYRTHYGHLSGFARGTARGRRVEQGDVIGYVGSTGISTGPHLDFRVEHNGRYVDPLRLAPVNMPTLSGIALADFERVRLERLTTLDDRSLDRSRRAGEAKSGL